MVIAVVYWVAPALGNGHIDYAGITMLFALGHRHGADGVHPRRRLAAELIARRMIEDIWHSLIEFTTQFVVPDWGSLIGCCPIGIAALVVLFLLWSVPGSRPPARRVAASGA